MRALILLSLMCLSCGPRLATIPAADLEAPGTTEAPFDTLAAWRKYPGQPKNRQVRGYYRKDSTYVKGYVRSGK